MATTSLSVRVPSEVKRQLERLAAATRRTRSGLAGEAIAVYVERELALIEGIRVGLEDVRAGRVVPHDEVMAEARALIDEAGRRDP